MNIPSDRKYLETHLWFRPDPVDEQKGTVGLTDDLQARLGDLIAVEFPRAGSSLNPDDRLVVLEGMLDALEIPAIVQMTLLEANARLEVAPDLANRDPYEKGFLAHVALQGVPRFMEAPDYAQFIVEGTVGSGA
jgi:glycine cleavage system H protein